MTLTLTLVAGADTAAPRSREVRGARFSLGRGADNDWVLPDPERHLSKRHCLIAGGDGFWEVTDLSTNGTYLNGDDAPIGHGNVRDLREGDRLRLGNYEIALRINETHRAPPVEQPTPVDSFALAVQPDHTPGFEDAFRPPRPVVLLDENWDLDGAPAVAAVAPAPVLDCVPAPEPAVDPSLLAAFLRGAGLPDARPDDPAATMEALGRAFRALVGGLRETLMARAAVKDEFRIAQTVIRTRGNNPLKFSASDDDAMLAMLGTGRRTDMAPANAVGEALHDIRLHELATMTAMQSAVRSLMRELDPARLRDDAGGGFGSQKARAWERFEDMHARLTRALADDFDSAFGRAFARAYEQVLKDGKA